MKPTSSRSAAFVLAFASFALVACSGAGDMTGTTAQPLLESCAGSYTCDGAGTSEPTRFTLRREGSKCTGGAAVFEASHDVTTDSGTRALGTWSGDSLAFELCADDGCLRCTNDDVEATEASEPSAKGGSCTGRASSCYAHAPGSCGQYSGCSMKSRAVYRNNQVHHYENECDGVPDACSTHDDAATCESEGCTWK